MLSYTDNSHERTTSTTHTQEHDSDSELNNSENEWVLSETQKNNIFTPSYVELIMPIKIIWNTNARWSVFNGGYNSNFWPLERILESFEVQKFIWRYHSGFSE
jgi:hypothetical protein